MPAVDTALSQTHLGRLLPVPEALFEHSLDFSILWCLQPGVAFSKEGSSTLVSLLGEGPGLVTIAAGAGAGGDTGRGEPGSPHSSPRSHFCLSLGFHREAQSWKEGWPKGVLPVWYRLAGMFQRSNR